LGAAAEPAAATGGKILGSPTAMRTLAGIAGGSSPAAE
jgi:hypothetical protein